MKKLIPSVLVFIFLAGISVTLVHGQTASGTVSVSGKLTNPFKTGGDLYQLAQMLIEQIVLPIGGILAVLAFVYSGFLYVVAQGDPGKLKTAHNALLYTAIGTAVLLGSWVIASVIQNTVHQLQS